MRYIKFMLQIVVVIYVAALVSQSTRFVEFHFESVNIQSRVDPAANVTACRFYLRQLINSYEQVGSLHVVKKVKVSVFI